MQASLRMGRGPSLRLGSLFSYLRLSSLSPYLRLSSLSPYLRLSSLCPYLRLSSLLAFRLTSFASPPLCPRGPRPAPPQSFCPHQPILHPYSTHTLNEKYVGVLGGFPIGYLGSGIWDLESDSQMSAPRCGVENCDSPGIFICSNKC